jgi:hypothetical protein
MICATARRGVPVPVVRRIVLLLSLLALVAPLAPAQAEPSGPARPGARLGELVRPLIDFRGAADPTVVQVGDQLVALSTGRNVPRAVAPTINGPWTDAGIAMSTIPVWALDARIWASDLVPTPTGWALYFSAPVAGLGPDGRCIGVATAVSPLDDFVPQQRPLVCPRRGVAEPAYDIAKPARKGLPKRLGVIDPEGFRDRDGRRYVLYRTQSRPSSLRAVQVPEDGLPTGARTPSVEVLRRGGVVENPVLVRRGKWWVLLTSQSYFGDCGYETTWRKARSLEGLASARKHVLLSQGTTGLCGPGGADLLGESVLVFHAWTCPELRAHCQSGVDYDKAPVYGAHRAMFAATLSWSSKAVPSISGFVAPTIDPWLGP